MQTTQLSSVQSLVGASVPIRRPFTSTRSARMIVRAQQSNDAAMKLIGAAAAVQVALMPFAGAAGAVDLPLAAATPDPIKVLEEKRAAAAADLKATVGKTGVAPDPVKVLDKAGQAAKDTAKAAKKTVVNPAKEFAAKNQAAKQATGAAKGAAKKIENPARDFARKAEQARKQASGSAKKVVNQTKAPANPAREFAAKAEQAKKKAKGALAVIDVTGLQQQALFGGSIRASPVEFSIFDTKSVDDARAKLQKNLDQAVQQQSDPAEKVVPETKPGESQEDNAERIRRQAEGGATEGGDARAPTN